MSILIKKSIDTIKKEGFGKLTKKAIENVKAKINPDEFFHKLNNDESGDVLFVSGEPKNPTSFYRCDIPVEQLQSIGMKASVIYYKFVTKEILSRFKNIIWYRIPLYPEIETLVEEQQKNGERIVYSIDDLLFDENSLRTQPWFADLYEQERTNLINNSILIRKFIEKSDAFISSTSTLAEEMLKIKKVPYLVSKNAYSKSQLKHSEEFKSWPNVKALGFFSGSFTHDFDLKTIAEDLKKLTEKYPDLVLYVVGRVNLPGELKDSKQIVKYDFLEKHEYQEVMSKCSLILNPLVENKHNFCKSETKYLQAALLSRPTINTKTPWLEKVIKNNETGILIENENWFSTLDTLLNDTEKLKLLGENAYNDIITTYNSTILGKELSEFLQNG